MSRQVHTVDADGEILGRLSTKIANLLRGKLKADFKPNTDCGDEVVITNADRIKVTGKKMAAKKYYRHSGYPGGLRERTLGEMLAIKPETVIRLAVRNMLPNNRLRAGWLKRLKFKVNA